LLRLKKRFTTSKIVPIISLHHCMRGEQYGKTSKDHDHQCRNELTERKKKEEKIWKRTIILAHEKKLLQQFETSLIVVNSQNTHTHRKIFSDDIFNLQRILHSHHEPESNIQNRKQVLISDQTNHTQKSSKLKKRPREKNTNI